jgi:hypothetical protein
MGADSIAVLVIAAVADNRARRHGVLPVLLIACHPP